MIDFDMQELTKNSSDSLTLPSGEGFLLKGIQTKRLCVLNKFIKKSIFIPTEAEQTPITCFSSCNIEYNLNRLFFSSLKRKKKNQAKQTQR